MFMYSSLLVEVSCSFLARNQGQDFLSECDDDAARKGQKTVRPLGWVVGFQAQTNLDDTKAEQNHTDRPNQSENEIGEIVDDS